LFILSSLASRHVPRLPINAIQVDIREYISLEKVLIIDNFLNFLYVLSCVFILQTYNITYVYVNSFVKKNTFFLNSFVKMIFVQI